MGRGSSNGTARHPALETPNGMTRCTLWPPDAVYTGHSKVAPVRHHGDALLYLPRVSCDHPSPSPGRRRA